MATAHSIYAAAPATSPSRSPNAARKPPALISVKKCWPSPKTEARIKIRPPTSDLCLPSSDLRFFFKATRSNCRFLKIPLTCHRRLRFTEPDELGTRFGRNAPHGPARRAAHRAGFWQAGECTLARGLFHALEDVRAAHRTAVLRQRVDL